MAEVIDLTVSPQREVIDISSGQESAPGRRNRTRETSKRRRGKKKSNGGASSTVGSSAQPSRAHSPEARDRHSECSEPAHAAKDASPSRMSPPCIDEPAFFVFDSAAAPTTVGDGARSPEPMESDRDESKLLLPSHVAILSGDASIPSELFLPPKLCFDDEECIEYIDYEDRKGSGLVRYFEVEGQDCRQPKPSISKCKNCGAEGDHKTYECPIQICLTCGARDEHSTRSCPISKTCYTCGMKGHINKTCPNRFSTRVASSDSAGDCDRCGFTEHKANECPTLWRIYQYMNDEERVAIMQSREKGRRLVIGEGGEGYIGGEMWCYNCANTGHLGDDCEDLPHPPSFPTEYSAFSSHNVMSGPFYDPAAELVSVERGSRERKSEIEWEAEAPAYVGKRGKDKDKQRLEKRFREQEGEDEDWFSDMRSAKRRGMGRETRPPRGPKALRFGLVREPSSPSTGEPSLLARLSDARGGKDWQGDRVHERARQPAGSIRIRGAATEAAGGERRDRGPRYRGGYDR